MTVKTNVLCGRHRLKKASANGQWQLSQKHKTHDACRSLVSVRDNLLSGCRVCWGHVTSALAPRKLKVEPLLVVPRLVRGLQPTGRRDDIDRAMTHQTPLTLCLGQDNEPAAFRPRATMGLTDGAPQGSDAGSWPWDAGVAEGGLK